MFLAATGLRGGIYTAATVNMLLGVEESCIAVSPRRRSRRLKKWYSDPGTNL